MPKHPRSSTSNKPSKSGKASQQGRVSIIGGTHRGRKLTFPDGTMVRPTLARIRETAFNWLMMEMAGKRVLDLFAGSGVLGLESLSRGALSADFVEQDRSLVQSLRSNIQQLGFAEQTTLHQQDARCWLTSQSPKQYDLIWLDPPFDLFDAEAVAEMVSLVEPYVSAGGVCYLEQPKRSMVSAFANERWEPLKHKTSADVQYGLWRKIV